MEMKNRVSWIDYARAIGIILVVYGHIARGLHGAGISMNGDLYRVLDGFIYSFHMPLFFFLSGYFFYYSYKKNGWIKLLAKKIDVILYPYIIWTIIQGIIVATLSKYTNGNASYSEILSLFWMPHAQFWFLYALFIISLIVIIIFTIFPEKIAIGLLPVTFLLYAVQYKIPYHYLGNLVINYLLYFCSGILFSLVPKQEIIGRKKILILLFAIFIIAHTLAQLGIDTLKEFNSIISIIIATISILFIISLCMQLANFKNKMFQMIGVSSMGIYILHILVGSGTRIILMKLLNIESYYFHITIGCILGIFIPMCIYFLIDKYKIPYIFYSNFNVDKFINNTV